MRKTDPKYRNLKRAGRRDLGFVDLGGKRVYLGAYGTAESRQKYHRLLAEWNANGRRFEVSHEELTVVELVAKFWHHAKQYYRRPDGSPTGTAETFRHALRPLRELYGSYPAATFGPRALKAVRQRMVDAGSSRRYVNDNVSRIKLMFRWAVAEELLPPSVYEALRAVPALKRGRSGARESPPVQPVPKAHVLAIRPHVSRQVWALIQLQQLTAARSGELVGIRGCDVDTSGSIWVYEPKDHKTAHHGRSRVIYFGPAAQTILEPFLRSRTPAVPLFSPRDAEQERRVLLHARRKTPLCVGNRPGSNRKESPRRRAGAQYTVSSYYQSIRRACKRAGLPAWHPHQLRHARATELRKDYGLEVARVVLGHASAAVTEIYAEADRKRAMDVMRLSG